MTSRMGMTWSIGMTWRIVISVIVVFIWGMALNHFAHEKTFKDQLVGTWSLEADGPKGRLVLEPAGGFSYLVLGRSADSVCDRAPGAPRDAQDRAVAYFGTYTVDDAKRTIALHIERGSSPDLNGTTQNRVIASVTRSELRAAAPGAPAEACVWKRAAGATPLSRNG